MTWGSWCATGPRRSSRLTAASPTRRCLRATNTWPPCSTRWEEAEELRSADSDDRLEAVDVYEVLLVIADHLGVDFKTVVSRAAEKRAERGGFTKRLWLESW